MEKKDLNLTKFTELLIKKMEEVNTGLQKPWFSGSFFASENIRGNKYSGGNAFMLQILCEMKGYELPVFLTFNQAKEEGISILKGEKSFPVYFFNFIVIHITTKEKISIEAYRELSEEEREKYNVFRNLKYYLVFNIEQTDMREKKPELYKTIKDKFSITVEKKSQKSVEILDDVIQNQSWYCPIIEKLSDSAYYSPGKDEIIIPERKQFADDIRYYSILLHEMAHSTGAKERLNRTFAKSGSKEYAHEELIAELTAAFSGCQLGVSTTIHEDNCKYIKGWIKNLKETPNYLYTILADVAKASSFIQEKIAA